MGRSLTSAHGGGGTALPTGASPTSPTPGWTGRPSSERCPWAHPTSGPRRPPACPTTASSGLSRNAGCAMGRPSLNPSARRRPAVSPQQPRSWAGGATPGRTSPMSLPRAGAAVSRPNSPRREARRRRTHAPRPRRLGAALTAAHNHKPGGSATHFVCDAGHPEVCCARSCSPPGHPGRYGRIQ